jgi:nucleoid-associated protein YgaU
MNGILNRKGAALLIVVAALTGVVRCGDAIPVQELNEARLQVDAAAGDQAEQYAAEQYGQARQALLDAHQKLADDDYKSAQAKAGEALGLALAAREAAAPQNVAARKRTAEEAIAAADVAYAETLAPNDFGAAQTLYNDGKSLESAGQTGLSEAAGMSLGAERARAVEAGLDSYSAAARKYTDAAAAAERAKVAALAQKQDMLDALSGVRSSIERAESWGAARSAADSLAAAKEKLAQAESEIQAGQLKQGAATSKEAETLAAETLRLAAAGYSGEMLRKAETSVSRSRTTYNRINTAANQRNENASAQLQTLGEQLAAANEALGSARANNEAAKHEESIRDSEEAIRLSDIVFEQTGLLAANIRGARVNVREEQKPQTETTTGGGESRNYTVRRSRPADCLWCIARRPEHYGNGRLWTRIYEANRESIGANPNMIRPGQVLVIPPKEGPVQPQKPAEQSPGESAPANQSDASMNDGSSDSMNDAPATETEGQPDENMQ